MPLGIWYHAIWSNLVQAIRCVLCLCVFKMHLFAYVWCLHTFVFQDQGEDSATLFELKYSRVVLSKTSALCILLYFSSVL